MTKHESTDLAAPLSCADAVRVLWDYLDGELDAARRERVREHLADCAHCRDQYTFEGEFLDMVDQLIDEPIDTSALRARLLAAMARRRGEQR